MATTVMFMHGMFLNAKSWEKWTAFFEAEGYDCIAPDWPLHQGDPAALRRKLPAGIGELPLDAVIAEMEEVASGYDDLILVGHSVGGLLVQILVSHGFGKLGVPICSVAPNRMLALDWGFFRNSATITNPLKGDEPFPMDADGFHQNFGNTMSRADSDAAFARYAMSESRNVLRDCLGPAGEIDLEAKHVPLLFIGAEKDEIVPSGLCQRNAKAYKDKDSRADFMEFKDRGHFICGEPKWEEVASYIANWIPGKADARTTQAERSAT